MISCVHLVGTKSEGRIRPDIHDGYPAPALPLEANNWDLDQGCPPKL